MRPLSRIAAVLAAGLLLPGLAAAQGLSRLVEVVDANDAERNVNVLVQLRCSARYVTHGPTDLGASVSVRLRLGPDCGTGGSVPSERPTIGGSSRLVRDVRLEEVMPGEVAITVQWAKTLNFVLAPTTDGRGFRVDDTVLVD